MIDINIIFYKMDYIIPISGLVWVTYLFYNLYSITKNNQKYSYFKDSKYMSQLKYNKEILTCLLTINECILHYRITDNESLAKYLFHQHYYTKSLNNNILLLNIIPSSIYNDTKNIEYSPITATIISSMYVNDKRKIIKTLLFLGHQLLPFDIKLLQLLIYNYISNTHKHNILLFLQTELIMDIKRHIIKLLIKEYNEKYNPLYINNIV